MAATPTPATPFLQIINTTVIEKLSLMNDVGSSCVFFLNVTNVTNFSEAITISVHDCTNCTEHQENSKDNLLLDKDESYLVRDISLGIVLATLCLLTSVGNAMVLRAVYTDKSLQTVSTTHKSLKSNVSCIS